MFIYVEKQQVFVAIPSSHVIWVNCIIEWVEISLNVEHQLGVRCLWGTGCLTLNTTLYLSVEEEQQLVKSCNPLDYMRWYLEVKRIPVSYLMNHDSESAHQVSKEQMSVLARVRPVKYCFFTGKVLGNCAKFVKYVWKVGCWGVGNATNLKLRGTVSTIESQSLKSGL